MKKTVSLMILATSFVLTACGAYVGSPPKTEVHDVRTTTAPPDQVRVYTHD